jgi:predicted amidophosphoribosyltransferase
MRLVSLLAPPLCAACRLPAAADAVLCSRCRRALERLGPEPLDLGGLTAWAPVAYEGPARALVRGLKLHGARGLAREMAAQVVANAPAHLLAAPLVPVPSPRARARRRGFCHAALLAEALAARTGLPVVSLLERVGAERQVGRARAQRVRMPPRFTARGARSGEVVLVDDVVTTGATLGACARALRGAGCTCERAVAFARTPVR